MEIVLQFAARAMLFLTAGPFLPLHGGEARPSAHFDWKWRVEAVCALRLSNTNLSTCLSVCLYLPTTYLCVYLSEVIGKPPRWWGCEGLRSWRETQCTKLSDTWDSAHPLEVFADVWDWEASQNVSAKWLISWMQLLVGFLGLEKNIGMCDPSKWKNCEEHSRHFLRLFFSPERQHLRSGSEMEVEKPHKV